ncbi:hypothetical protein [Streptacidiphilus sp. P02-A3a]|uniref:SCO6745 family protein n=1 Tax=Streptacidiphilus sp. P02-A3a TaxID=2704468 RepID=UPI0015F9EC15|nr:hypothetical protein [Streptacidiphilus sp. P02-A3a]QMU70713.1 hypothetical protein GXP74_23400 [Streptacidiphilus sp. P02-A3a]
MTLPASKRCFRALNPLHTLIYFVPEAEEEYTAAGLRPGRMGYFASRSAALGAVGPGPVAATFFNFKPALVARHLPRAWTLATPEQVLAARLRAVDRALTRLLGAEALADPAVAEAAELAGAAAAACTFEGRPLAAAHAELPVPEPAHLALWHAATVLREHRGDGHLAALMTAELDGLEALVTHTATGKGFKAEFARVSRDWSQEEWDAAVERLRARGLLDREGALTEAGTELRRGIERQTARLAAGPYERLGEKDLERLAELTAPLATAVLANGAIPSGPFA